MSAGIAGIDLVEENSSSRMNTMAKKVIDLMTYRIEKTLKENGFEVKKDDNKNIKILIKLKNND
jgi:hypothetical protein